MSDDNVDNDAPIIGANTQIAVTIEQIAALARVIGCPITSLIQRM